MTEEDKRRARETFVELEAAVSYARDALTRGHTLDAGANISAILLSAIRLFAILARIDPQAAGSLKGIWLEVFRKAGV